MPVPAAAPDTVSARASCVVPPAYSLVSRYPVCFEPQKYFENRKYPDLRSLRVRSRLPARFSAALTSRYGAVFPACRRLSSVLPSVDLVAVHVLQPHLHRVHERLHAQVVPA